VLPGVEGFTVLLLPEALQRTGLGYVLPAVLEYHTWYKHGV